jgi:hypothetical protein
MATEGQEKEEQVNCKEGVGTNTESGKHARTLEKPELWPENWNWTPRRKAVARFWGWWAGLKWNLRRREHRTYRHRNWYLFHGGGGFHGTNGSKGQP